jgi:BolA protein
MVSKDYIQEKIMKHLQAEVVEVKDISDGAAKFEVLIVSDDFLGKTLIQRHRLIYSIFSEELQGPIHALSLKTLTRSQHSND